MCIKGSYRLRGGAGGGVEGSKRRGNKYIHVVLQILLILQSNLNGRLAEWLGIGLQNRVRRFEPTERREGAR